MCLVNIIKYGGEEMIRWIKSLLCHHKWKQCDVVTFHNHELYHGCVICVCEKCQSTQRNFY